MYELIYLKWDEYQEELVEVTGEFDTYEEMQEFINRCNTPKKTIQVISVEDL